MDRIINSAIDFRSLESLSVLVLKSTQTPSFPPLPKSIRVLDISENQKIQWSLQDLVASTLPNLESFKVDDNPEIENVHVSVILAPSWKNNSLRSLSLKNCPKMDFHSLEWLMRHGESIEELSIGGNSTITDEVLKEVAKLGKLRYLELYHCGISGIGLMSVVNGSLGALREVRIFGCKDISSYCVQLAAESGVKVISRLG